MSTSTTYKLNVGTLQTWSGRAVLWSTDCSTKWSGCSSELPHSYRTETYRCEVTTAVMFRLVRNKTADFAADGGVCSGGARGCAPYLGCEKDRYTSHHTPPLSSPFLLTPPPYTLIPSLAAA
ncbi:hypothetical protein EVAR_25911_1 [Eumeta japonica]|uniref:Uncharacterized protein n=1 Tax=Eumeta variegata TaxID=151549 RepID=A0A4C1W515_EUMVA|nr:hypothetical protein EVAR_25911_1 [Eumeta japonica]